MKKEVKKRHYFWKKIFILFPAGLIARSYRFKTKKYKIKNTGPYLILGNHTVAVDPVLMSKAFDAPIYFVASEQIFNLGILSKALLYFFNPIAKTKSLSDISTIRKMKKIIKEGGNIGIYVEGNLSYTGENPTIPFSIAKLIKYLGLPVIFYVTKGLYLSNPRWSLNRKYGASSGWVNKIWEKEEYASLSDEEIDQYVKENLYHNCFDEQLVENTLYKGKDIALGLERLLYLCPKCHKPAFKSEHDHLVCEECGYTLKYQENGFIKDQDDYTYTLVDLENQQRINLVNYLNDFKDEVIFKDQGIKQIATRKGKKHGIESIILITKNGIAIDNELTLYQDILSVAVQGKNKLIIYYKEKETILFVFKNLESPYKYLNVYKYYKLGGNENDSIDITKLGL